jgi:hypothetical protein
MFFNEILWKKGRSESFVGSLLSNSVFYLCSINNWFLICSSMYGISLVQYSACVSIYIEREIVWKLQIGLKSRYRFDFTGNTKNSTVIKSPLPFTLILHMWRRSYPTQSLCTWSVLLPWRMYWCVSSMLWLAPEPVLMPVADDSVMRIFPLQCMFYSHRGYLFCIVQLTVAVEHDSSSGCTCWTPAHLLLSHFVTEPWSSMQLAVRLKIYSFMNFGRPNTIIHNSLRGLEPPRWCNG